MTGQNIAAREGNWGQLRYLVMRLLEEHEEALEDIKGIVHGNDADGGLCSRIKVLQSQVETAREQLKAIDTKADAAHKKANENAQRIAVVKPDGTVDRKMVAGLLAVVTVLSTGLGKLIELVVQLFSSGGGQTP